MQKEGNVNLIRTMSILACKICIINVKGGSELAKNIGCWFHLLGADGTIFNDCIVL